MVDQSRPRLPLRLIVPALLALLIIALAVARWAPRREADDPPIGTPSIVFAEFGPAADRIYSAPASDPSRRTLIATVDHAEGWGINASPAMAGSLAAYTVLPPDGPARRDAPAELWLLDVRTGDRTRLARDADLLVAPVFNREATQLAYRSAGPFGEQLIVRVDLITRARRVMYAYEGNLGVYPFGFDAGGDLLFARLSTGGSDLFRVRDGQAPELIAHASDEIVRDWRISPDGLTVSFLAPEVLAERVVHRVRIAVLDGGSVQSLPAGDELGGEVGEHFSPVWTPAGDGLTVGREAYPAASAAAVTLALGGGPATPLAQPERGFDAPLGWSADGRYLAARTFDGTSAHEPGRESVVVIAADGARHAVVARADVIFLGWIASG